MLAKNPPPLPKAAWTDDTRQNGYMLLMPKCVPVISLSHHNLESVGQVGVFTLIGCPGFGGDVSFCKTVSLLADRCGAHNGNLPLKPTLISV